MLAREGLAPNHKKLPRIYREEGLKVRRRGGRKRLLGMPPTPLQSPQPSATKTENSPSEWIIQGRHVKNLINALRFSSMFL
jgi:putative transposase